MKPLIFFLLVVLLPGLVSEAPGQEQTLPTQHGYLTIIAPAGSDVYLDEAKIAATPLQAHALPAGTYRLTLRRTRLLSWYQPDWMDTITISPGDTLVIRPEFITLYKITSTPQGARVLNGEQVLGTTPFTLKLKTGETLSLSIEQDGYFPAFIVCNEASPRIRHVVLERDLDYWQNFTRIQKEKIEYRKSMRRNAMICAGVSIAGGIASILLRQQADRYYGRYQAVLDSRRMDAYLEQTRRYDLYSGAAFALFEVSFGLGFYFFLKSE